MHICYLGVENSQFSVSFSVIWMTILSGSQGNFFQRRSSGSWKSPLSPLKNNQCTYGIQKYIYISFDTYNVLVMPIKDSWKKIDGHRVGAYCAENLNVMGGRVA